MSASHTRRIRSTAENSTKCVTYENVEMKADYGYESRL